MGRAEEGPGARTAPYCASLRRATRILFSPLIYTTGSTRMLS